MNPGANPGPLFRSKLRVIYPERFNSNYVVNLLGGKECTIRKKNILGVNLKLSYMGGEYYVPIRSRKSGPRESFRISVTRSNFNHSRYGQYDQLSGNRGWIKDYSIY